MPYKPVRTNKRKSPKRSRCIRLRSRTRGGMPPKSKSLTPQAHHARKIGIHNANAERKHPLLAMDHPPPIPEDDGLTLQGLICGLRKVKGEHVILAITIACLAQLCYYTTPENVAMAIERNVLNGISGVKGQLTSPLYNGTYSCRTGLFPGQIGPPNGSQWERFISFLADYDGNLNDDPRYIAAMEQVEKLDASIRRNQEARLPVRRKLILNDRGHEVFKSPQEVDAAYAEKVALDDIIAKEQEERGSLLRSAEEIEADSRR
jgi:hypothetical protein